MACVDSPREVALSLPLSPPPTPVCGLLARPACPPDAACEWRKVIVGRAHVRRRPWDAAEIDCP